MAQGQTLVEARQAHALGACYTFNFALLNMLPLCHYSSSAAVDVWCLITFVMKNAYRGAPALRVLRIFVPQRTSYLAPRRT